MKIEDKILTITRGLQVSWYHTVSYACVGAPAPNNTGNHKTYAKLVLVMFTHHPRTYGCMYLGMLLL